MAPPDQYIYIVGGNDEVCAQLASSSGRQQRSLGRGMPLGWRASCVPVDRQPGVTVVIV
jgi:hypothetical protein